MTEHTQEQDCPNGARGRSATASGPFIEVQRFRQAWGWALMLTSTLWPAGCSAHAMLQQLALDIPFGNQTDSAALLVSASTALLFLGTLWLFERCELRVRVDSRGVRYQFFPFHLRVKQLDFAAIESVEAKTYSPLLEYGGWGIRWGANGKAYNVNGDRGVLFRTKDGTAMLIGSQRSQALAEAIHAMMRRSAPGGEN